MYTSLFTLHLLLRAVPYSIELALFGLIGAGWLLARTRIEYNAQLQHPSRASLLLMSVCGCACWMFAASLTIDSILFQNYARLPLFGAMLVLLLIGASVCQTIGQHAAQRRLEKHGYEHGYMPILPKQR